MNAIVPVDVTGLRQAQVDLVDKGRALQGHAETFLPHVAPSLGAQLRVHQRHQLLQGTLDMLVLRTLQWGPRHGHGIGQAIRTQSDELLKVETGSLYPALHRLEKRGWLKSEWGVSEANQKAKYYRLTAAGKAQLARESDRWAQLVHAIGRIMNPAAADGD